VYVYPLTFVTQRLGCGPCRIILLPILILILFYYKHLGLLNAFSPSGFPIKSLYAFLFSLKLANEQVGRAVKLCICVSKEHAPNRAVCWFPGLLLDPGVEVLRSSEMSLYFCRTLWRYMSGLWERQLELKSHNAISILTDIYNPTFPSSSSSSSARTGRFGPRCALRFCLLQLALPFVL
jgi:hypothetical protein